MATKILQTIVGAIIASSGLMISLIWGLALTSTNPVPNPFLIQGASVFLLLAIVSGLLSLQFAITKIGDVDNLELADSPTDADSVAGSFLLSWLFYLAGGSLVVAAIFSSA